MQLEKKRVVLFIVFAIGFGWAIFLSLPLFGIHYGQKASIIILAVGMFTPTMSNLLTRLITKEGFTELYLKPNFKQNIKKYIVLYFGPTLLLFVSATFLPLIVTFPLDLIFFKEHSFKLAYFSFSVHLSLLNHTLHHLLVVLCLSHQIQIHF
jgi:hypothetical protein